MSDELGLKLERLRLAMAEDGLGAVRLRGTDWFSWIACGGSNVVLLAAETGIAQALVTEREAWILTNSIEAARLEREQLPPGFKIFAPDWPDADPASFIAARSGGRPVASDRPVVSELLLPEKIVSLKRKLSPQEIERYRLLGRDAAQAMREVLGAAVPDWSEHQLAAAGAKALLERGIEPALILAGGEARVEKYRHPTPTASLIGKRAMLVFCARRHGLFANLTRFVYFSEPAPLERKRAEDAAKIEASAFAASTPGALLGEIFEKIASAYAALGYPGGHLRHHQGGTTGYLSRESVACPGSPERLAPSMALAWNPSLPGAKIEDTVLLAHDGLEVLTADPLWPAMQISGRSRPDIWVRK